MKQISNAKSFYNPVILTDETARRISALIENSKYNVSQLQNLFCFESPQAIYNWKEGKTLPSLDNILKLAYFLNTTVDDIIVAETRKNSAEKDVPEEFRINRWEK